MERPEIVIDFGGEEGNSYFIVGKASYKLLQLGRNIDAGKMLDEFKMASSYDDVLKIVSKYLKIVPINAGVQVKELLNKIEEELK